MYKNIKEVKWEKIEQNDLKIIEEIANKYGITVQEFGKILTKGSTRVLALQFYTNDDENMYLQNCAKEYGMKLSKYIVACCRKGLDEKKYENINLYEIYPPVEKSRKDRVGVSFDKYNRDVYYRLVEVAEEKNLKAGNLARYFAFNIKP